MDPKKIMLLKACDIYVDKKFDAEGNFNEDLNNPVEYDASFFKSSLGDSLELRKLMEVIDKKKAANHDELYYNNEFLYSIINVSFDHPVYRFKRLYLKEPKSKKKKDNDSNNKDVEERIYIKNGYKNIEHALAELKDNCFFIIKDELIAIKTNVITEENSIVKEKYYTLFMYDENNKTYRFKKSSMDKEDTEKIKDKSVLKNISCKELRKDLYKHGFSIKYGKQIINYERYKRSSSEARGGNCLFIDKNLKGIMENYSYFGLPLYNKKVQDLVVEIEAYKSLTLSTIEGTIKIKPKNILILPDYEYEFETECIKVSSKEFLNNNGKKENYLEAKKEKCKIKNKIWDGEGLLDSSFFEGEYKNKGMVLLRNNFFKCCAFNTNLQKWFEDNKITDISQLNDKRITLAEKISDIKFVITYSSLKYIKFSSEGWTDYLCKMWLENITDEFGVVKTEHPGKRFNGKLVETSYQFLNTLELSQKEIKELSEDYVNYIKKMRLYEENGETIRNENESSFVQFALNGEHFIWDRNEKISDEEESYLDEDIEDNNQDYDEINEEDNSELISEDEANRIYNDLRNKVCIDLLSINDKFEKTSLYYNLRNDITNSFLNKIRVQGRLLVKGTNATLFGNGYEFLQYIIGEFDGTTSLIKPGEAMSLMFKDNEKLCGVRYPHITMGNLYKFTNKYYDEYFKKDENDKDKNNGYFNLTNEIICVNAIGENIQHRLNGCDYDSDFMTVTNNKIIYKAIEKNYNEFLVPFNDVKEESPKSKILYMIDNQIANNLVGLITNLSQHLNSIYWDMKHNGVKSDILEDLYKDICKLALICGMEIDKAKRHYNVQVRKEISKIKNKWINNEEYADKYKLEPKFLRIIENKKKEKKNKNKENDNILIQYNSDGEYKYYTTMNFLNDINIDFPRSQNSVGLLKIISDEHKDWTASNKSIHYPKAQELYECIDRYMKDIDIHRKEIVKTNDSEEIIKSKKEFKKYVKEKWYECYKEVFKKGNKLLTNYPILYYFCTLIGDNKGKNKVKKDDKDKKYINRRLWAILYIIYLAKENKHEKYKNLFYELLETKNKPKKLIRVTEDGDEKIFGFSFKYQ